MKIENISTIRFHLVRESIIKVLTAVIGNYLNFSNIS